MKTATLLLTIGLFMTWQNSTDAQSLLPNTIRNGEEPIPKFIEWPVNNERQHIAKVSAKDTDGTIFLHQTLKLNAETEAILTDSTTDFIGDVHRFYTEYYKGIKVEGTRYAVHYKRGAIYSMNGNFHTISNFNVTPSITENVFNVTPSITENVATNIVLKYVGNETYDETKIIGNNLAASHTPKGELVIFVKDNTPHLTYKFDITATKPTSEQRVFVDAQTGDIVQTFPLSCHAMDKGFADTRYSGRQEITTEKTPKGFLLKDASRGQGIYTMKDPETIIFDNDNNWTAREWHNSSLDDAALDAHWGMEQVYDYFYQKFGRNSYDGKGAILKNIVNYPYLESNAGWSHNDKCMYYGITPSKKPVVCLDILAHEMAHGITQFTSDLIYSGESGAIDEGFSDIWGVCVERFAKGDKGSALWTLGEELNEAYMLRNLKNPKCKYYGGEGWVDTKSGNDHGGVHTNSGVMSYWFYTLVNGGVLNGKKVYGIGFDKAEQICYLLHTTRMASNSAFSDVMSLSIDVAQSIFGKSSEEAISVNNAWYIVGVADTFITTSISGPKFLKNGETATYTLKNAPTDAQFELGGLKFVSYNGKELTVKATGNARAFINVKSASNNVYGSYSVWIGVPIISAVTYNSRDHILEVQTFGGDPQINNVIWSVYGGGYSIYPNKYHPYLTQGTVDVSVRGTNNCGTGPEYTCRINLGDNGYLSIRQSEDSRSVTILSTSDTDENNSVIYRLANTNTGVTTYGSTSIGSTLHFNEENAGLYILELQTQTKMKSSFKIIMK